MSRWYLTGEEQRGYDDRREAGNWPQYPYEKSHEYREGWDDAEREASRERERREEAEAAEQAEELRLAQERRMAESQFEEPNPDAPT